MDIVNNILGKKKTTAELVRAHEELVDPFEEAMEHSRKCRGK